MQGTLQDSERADIIGKGGFGSVFAGTNKHNGDRVAVKIISKYLGQRLVNE